VPQEVPNNEVIEDQDVDFDASLDMDESLDTSAPPPDDSEEEEEEQEIFMVVENQPELIGGMKALQESVTYPDFAKKAGIEGRVIVQFVVDEKGNVTNPKVVRGVHKLLNEEAIKAVKDQKFKPGKQRGKPVKVQMSLPVTFRLQ
jgi:protein TonB